MGIQAIRAGNAVTIYWSLVQGVKTGLPIPYDPPVLPTVSIFDPTGTLQINEGVAAKVQSGLYAYEYVTPADPATDQIGVWLSWITAIDAAGNPVGSAFTPRWQAATPSFRLVPATG